MEDYADLILAQINSPDFDEKMLEYIAHNDDPSLFVEKTYSTVEPNLLTAFLKKHKQNLLCAILERFPSLAKIQDKFGYTFLFDAAHERLEQVCLKALDNLEVSKIQNVHGETFLHEAMSQHLTSVGLKALKTPELVTLQDKRGNTFLHNAAFNAIKPVCMEAATHPKFAEIKNARGKTYLDIAKENGLFDTKEKTSPLDRLLDERKKYIKAKTK